MISNVKSLELQFNSLQDTREQVKLELRELKERIKESNLNLIRRIDRTFTDLELRLSAKLDQRAAQRGQEF